MNLLTALKGLDGGFEINRVLGGAGVLVYIVTAPAFEAWNIAQGHPFDLNSFCTDFPFGLGMAIGAVAGSVALKDRNVAAAKLTNAQADAAKAAGQ